MGLFWAFFFTSLSKSPFVMAELWEDWGMNELKDPEAKEWWGEETLRLAYGGVASNWLFIESGFAA